MNKLDNIQLLETICSRGCTYVNEVISILESGQSLEQTQQLSAVEQQSLLAELKSIMAVYEVQKPSE